MPANSPSVAVFAPDPANDFSRYTLVALFDEVRSLMAQRHALNYRLLGVLRELDQRQALDSRPLHLAS